MIYLQQRGQNERGEVDLPVFIQMRWIVIQFANVIIGQSGEHRGRGHPQHRHIVAEDVGPIGPFLNSRHAGFGDRWNIKQYEFAIVLEGEFCKQRHEMRLPRRQGIGQKFKIGSGDR